MKKRNFLRLTRSAAATMVILTIAILLRDASAVAKATDRGKPNILLIVSEDNGPHLGCYGDTNIKTPNLDKLAAEGVRFERAFVTTASCSESRSSILTGLYPHQNGHIGLASHKYAMYRKYDNIPSLLKKEGYRTGIIGKLHVNPGSAFPFDFGWNDSKFCHFFKRDVRKIAEVAERFITASQQPFFLMVNYPDAHAPFLRQEKGIPAAPLGPDDVAVLPFIGVDTPKVRQGVADYYNCMSRLDTGVGMLLEKLAGAGRAENTLVIYLGDHGAMFARGKLTCYEAGLRVPLIIRWPGHASQDLVRNDMVSTVDILPTILQAVGAEVPPGLAGRSLVPLIKGGTVPWREYLFAEYHAHYPPIYFPQRTVRDGRYKLIVNLLQDRPNPIRQEFLTSRWTHVRVDDIPAADKRIRRAFDTWRDAPPEQLYDLQKDPHEFDDLAGKPEYAAVQKRLRAELETWRKQSNDPLTDPDNLARLTKEHDSLPGNYMKDKSFKWQYLEYLGSFGQGRE